MPLLVLPCSPAPAPALLFCGNYPTTKQSIQYLEHMMLLWQPCYNVLQHSAGTSICSTHYILLHSKSHCLWNEHNKHIL